MTNEELGLITEAVLAFRSPKTTAAKSDAEIDAQVTAWLQCLGRRIREADDGKVPSVAIAQVVMPQCHKFYGGPPENEKSHIIDIVATIRNRAPEPVVVTPPTPLPPAEIRF